MDNVAGNQLQYAGFWVRAAAYILDSFLLVIPSFFLNFIFLEVAALVTGGDYGGMDTMNFYKGQAVDSASLSGYFNIHSMVYIINCIFFVFIFKMFLTSNWQATPGKRMMNIYVVDTLGRKLSTKKAVLRTALPILVFILYTLSMNYRTVELEKQITPEANFIDDVKAALPVTYNHFVESELDEFVLLEGLTVAISYVQEMDEGNVKVKDIIEKLRSFGGGYDEKKLELLEVVFEEYLPLNVEEREIVKKHVGELGAEALASALKIMLIVFLFFIVIFVWYIMAAFTKEKTTIHDIIAKTRVIKGRP